MPSVTPAWRPLDVAVIGGGLGGLAAAVGLRRAGHNVTIHERRNFSLEVGASISCAANGQRWLEKWNVNIAEGKPVILKNLIMRDWQTGEVMSTYKLDGYKEKWGTEYRMYHRVDMHRMLLNAATQQEGEGTPCKLVVNHVASSVDCDAGTVTFENGRTITADLIVGADGVSSKVRAAIGVVPDLAPAGLTCIRCNIEVAKLRELGLEDYSLNEAIDYWGGQDRGDGIHKYFKLVLGGMSDNKFLSFYCFLPAELSSHHKEGFQVAEVSHDELLGYYPHLDPTVKQLLANSIDRMPWRLWIHQPYSHWTKGKALILGDAAHPMLPNQSQGACMAIEDAAALSLIFSKEYGYSKEEAIEDGVKLYQDIRYDRATQVQAASIRATEDINERIGFSSLPEAEERAAFKQGKLTIDIMNGYDMAEHVARLATPSA